MVAQSIAKLKHVSFPNLTPFSPKYSRQLALPNLTFEDDNSLLQRYVKKITSSRLKISLFLTPQIVNFFIHNYMAGTMIIFFKSWHGLPNLKSYPARVFT